MRSGNPITGLRLEQNLMHINRINNQQNIINQQRNEGRNMQMQSGPEISNQPNNNIGDKNNKSRLEGKSSDKNIKINLKKS